MTGRYERVNSGDVDEPTSTRQQHPETPIPNSPPPSFHSRPSSRASSSSRERELERLTGRGRRVVDPALADAFGTDDDDDEDDDGHHHRRSDDSGDESGGDEADDRQRLMRHHSQQSSSNSTVGGVTASSTSPSRNPPPSQPQPQPQPTRTTGRVYGGGTQSDGVFSNITAKPEVNLEKDEQPPTYEQAAADAAPPYWETTILAPGLGGSDEVFIDGMPVGSAFSFVWNGMVSMSFQIVGFLLTYLLHSTHAAKNGSRAGLGITLIQYGFYMKGTMDDDAPGGGGSTGAASANSNIPGSPDGFAAPPDPNAHDFDPSTVGAGGAGGGDGAGGPIGALADIASSEWVAYVLMIVGWFILMRAVADYLKARRHEQLVLQSPDRGLGVAIIAEGENPEHVV